MRLAQIGILQTGFHPYYKAILAKGFASGYSLPSTSQQVLQNNLVTSLVANNIWSNLDVLYIFGTNGDSDFATINWITPSSFQSTKVNSPTFNSNQGFSTNGSTSYLNTNWTPNTDAVKFQQNNASLGVWFHTGGDGGAVARTAIGVNSSANTRQFLLSDSASGNIGSRLNQSGAATPVNFFTGTASFGNQKMYSVDRTSSAAGSQYVDGSSVSTFTNTSTGMPLVSVYLLGRNNDGSLDLPGLSSWKLSVAFFGNSSINQSSFYTSLNTYMTSI